MKRRLAAIECHRQGKQSTMRTSAKKTKFNFVKWIATLAAFLLNLQIGLLTGWISPNIAWLLSVNSPIPMTPSQVSWMMSVASLGGPVGAIVGSILVEYLGSRKTVLATFLTTAVSWTCILFANSAAWLYAARLVAALPYTMLFCCFSLYLSEVTEPKHRGAVISLAMAGLPIGMLLATIAETYLAKTASTLIYLMAALVGAAITCWLKDTPYILSKREDSEGARRSIEFYRASVDVNEESQAVRLFVEKSEGIGNKLTRLRSPSVRKSMFVICLAFALPQIGGLGVVLVYMQVIFTKAKVQFIEPADCVIYNTVISILACALSFRLPDKLGRRFLFAASSVGTAVSLIFLGLHFHLLQLGYDSESLQWLPIASLAAYTIAYDIGYATVPGTLLSEMFPENIKSLASCAATLSSSISAFAVLKAYQPIVDAVGDACAFWILAGLSTLGIFVTWFLLIETKGKTFQQIQDELDERSN